MELVGEEKRIQALYSELRFADARVMPAFATVLGRARWRDVRPLRAFNLSFALATALLVCTLVGLALWSSAWQRSVTNVSLLAVPPVVSNFPAPSMAMAPGPFPSIAESATLHNERLRALRIMARRRAAELAQQRAEITAAAAISDWQSPTATLLSSQNDALLNSLPQFSESVKDLKSFLPNK